MVLPERSALGNSVVHSGSKCSRRSAAFSPAIILSELTAVGASHEEKPWRGVDNKPTCCLLDGFDASGAIVTVYLQLMDTLQLSVC